MENDLDMKLYNQYLNGEKEALEILYHKYKAKIQYFVYNMVKDYQKAEDITQDVFMYLLQEKFKQQCSFKCYLYMIAKSRALNQIYVEKRKQKWEEQYIIEERDFVEQDVIEIVEKHDTQKKMLEAIGLLDDNYKNAVYLVKIEGLSYQETAEILGETIQNVKNLIHRGKKELRKILVKKGFDEMKKVFIIILCVSIAFSGIVYAATQIYEAIKGKAEITPIYTGKISNVDTNKVWVGTFNLVWNDFMDDVIGGKIEFEDGDSELANELNKQSFTVSELSEDAYFKIQGESTLALKEKIEKGIQEKFHENSKVLEKVNWGDPNSYTIYAMLKKEFNYLEKFPTLPDATFGNATEKVKYFGITPSTLDDAKINVEVLFYESKEDFAIKLKTKEGEEVILYKGTGEGKSFEENYADILEKQSHYEGEKTLQEQDTLKIPFIQIRDAINYDELCGRMIKGTNWYIAQALQTIDFELNNYGGSVKSEALIEALKMSVSNIDREFDFDSDFLLYLKEASKSKPYFALKVDNTDVLVSSENDGTESKTMPEENMVPQE